MKKYAKVLSIAGSDSGGGAGIQADIKAISACGGFATTVITAITAQNTLGVSHIEGLSLCSIEAQLRAVLSDIGTDTIKVGMLHSSEIIQLVSNVLEEFEYKYLVVDPVMVATSGDVLLEKSAVESLKNILLPKASLITPNIPEAEILLGVKISDNADLKSLSEDLANKFKTSVLLKAGHLKGDLLTDVFYDYDNKTTTELTSKRINTKNTHGTGCTLSSAISTYLAVGNPMEKAVLEGKEYLYNALENGSDYTIGKGHGPVNHFYKK